VTRDPGRSGAFSLVARPDGTIETAATGRQEGHNSHVGNLDRDMIEAMGAKPKREPEFAEPPIHVDWTLAFSRPETKKAHAYWDSVRGARIMPARSDLSPRGMREFLTHVNLVGVCQAAEDGSIDYEVALQGSHGSEVFGPLARRRLAAGLSAVTTRRLRECFDLVRDSGRPVRINSRVTGGEKFWLDSESLMAPLGDEAGRVTTIMWVFVSWDATKMERPSGTTGPG